MIKYALACDKGHTFESWFADSAAYDKQAKHGLVTCPQCGSAKVEKAIMAPRLSGTRKRATAQEVATAPDKPGGVDHTIDAGVYIPKETPAPTPTPTPTPTTPGASTPPSPVPSANQPTPAGGGGGSLASTGTRGLTEMIGLVGLLVGAGLVITFVTRNRRTRRH